MKNNLTTILENANLETLRSLVDDYNGQIMDGNATAYTFDDITKVCDKINADEQTKHTEKFLSVLATDRKTAFANLLENPCFDKRTISLGNDGKITISDAVAVVNSVVDIEKVYRLKNSKKTNKNGKPIPDESVTIFGVTRFYGLLEKFVQNLVINQVEGANEYKTVLTRIKLDDVTFTENDGKAFDATSTTALDKQMRVLAKFFGDNDIKSKKKDIVLLRTQAIKMRFKTDVLHLDFAESKTNAFLTTLYKYFISVYNKHETVLTNSNGKTAYLITEAQNKGKGKATAVDTVTE